VDFLFPGGDDLCVAPEIDAYAFAGQIGQKAAALGNAGRGVQSNRLPDTVDVYVGDTVVPQYRGREIRALHFETGLAVREGAGAEIVHDGRGEEQVTIVGGIVQTSLVYGEELREEEAAHAVIRDRGTFRGPHGGKDGIGQGAGGEVE
jgi:hypothetical protein